MAAAVVTTRRQNQVQGGLRVFCADSIAFTNNGDTFTVPGMKRVSSIDFTPTSNASYGFTVAGNVITLVSGGGVTFLGQISGL
jgi:hypothetical protein